MDFGQFEKVDKGDVVWIVLDEEYDYPADPQSFQTHQIPAKLFKGMVLGKLCDADNWGAYVHLEDSGRKKEFFQHHDLFLDPLEAVDDYVVRLDRRLKKTIPPEERDNKCTVFGGKCVHTGWCDECPLVTED